MSETLHKDHEIVLPNIQLDAGRNVLKRLGGDLLAAGAASLVAAPIVSVMDTAITQNAAGTVSLRASVRNSIAEMGPGYLRTPQFRWIWFVYGSTYAAANVADTVSEARGVDRFLPVLCASTAVNTSAAIAKDSAFAKMFGSGAPRRVPGASYALWLARDAVSMACIFALPPYIALYMQERAGYTERSSQLFAQLGTPVAAQATVTWLHLGGLDHYNRRGVSINARIEFLRAEVHGSNTPPNPPIHFGIKTTDTHKEGNWN